MNRKILKVTLVAVLLAMAIALDVVTGMIPGLNLSMPLGGRIFGIALFPLLLIGIFLGASYGITAGIIYGIFGFFSDGYAIAFFVDDTSSALLVFFLDYIIAFGALGLTGFFPKALKKGPMLIMAFSLAIFVRFVSSTIVGAILWAQYAHYSPWTNDLYDLVDGSAFLYSGIYNFIYNFTTAITLILIGLIMKNRLQTLKEEYLLN